LRPPKQNPRTKAGGCVDLAGGLEATNQRTQRKSSTDSDILDSKSTANEVQLAKVLALLRQGPKTTIELRHHAIMMPAARVFQLKREHDCTITTELVTLYDDQGVRHRSCARYHLIERQPAQASLDLQVQP
jgi:hypothetical protein